MADVVERRIGELTIRIDRLLCVGFGDCMAIAAEVFHFDDEGVAAFKAEAPVIEAERLIRSCAACPVDALSVFDARGRQIVP
ncbi:MAG: ferredoxin [Gemmatimonadetes bacterium]|nr:ferredoxin [Gemmatimonadota bacterium]